MKLKFCWFYFIAIRSGDYYMFEFPDDDIDLELAARHRRVEDEDEDSAEVKEKGLNAVIKFEIKFLILV